jgi:hypothetical protein
MQTFCGVRFGHTKDRRWRMAFSKLKEKSVLHLALWHFEVCEVDSVSSNRIGR